MNNSDKQRLRDKVIEKITKEGVWAILFISLLAYVIHDSREREAKYQETIQILSTTLSTDIKSIGTEINDLKKMIKEGR